MIIFSLPGTVRRSLAIKSLIVIILTLSLTGGFAFGQDILTLKSGKEMKVTIVEEGSDIIRYRDFENSAGPLYSISKDKVAGIKYKKGSKPVTTAEQAKPEITEEPVRISAVPVLTAQKRKVLVDGKPQSARNVKTIMADYPEAIKEYESGKKMYNLSNGCAGAIIITSFLASQAAKNMEDPERQATLATGLAIDGLFIISAILLSSAGKKKIRNSVALYNSAAGKPVSYKLNLGLQEHGIGLALRF